jgi:hypothetical protein
MKLRTLLIVVFGAAAAVGGASASAAPTPWQVQPAGRAEASHRLGDVSHEGRRERVDAFFIALQARRVEERDRMIRVEDHRFARSDSGHLTASSGAG